MSGLIQRCLGIVAILAVFYFVPANVNAGVFSECSPCGEVLCGPCEPARTTKTSQWEFGGWVEAGFYANQYGQRNSYQPGKNHNLYIPGNSELLSNVQRSDFQMNQVWLYFEKPLDTRRGFDLGGRVDFVYGTDAFYMQSDGLEFRSRTANFGQDNSWGKGDYYASVAQLYAEVGFRDVSVQVGKFGSPFGYESDMSPDRFFYSWSYSADFMPNTHSGVMATWAANDKLSLVGGWSGGMNQTFYNQDDNTIIFGAIFTPVQKISLEYYGAVGRDKSRHNSTGGNFNDHYFFQSLIMSLKPNNRWEYVLEWSLCNMNNGMKPREYSGFYGINNELICRLNEQWAVGFRAEWMHAFEGEGDNANFYEYTVGLNWTPSKWLLVRPEMRYDRYFGADNPFNTQRAPRSEQFSGGVSAVVKF